MLVLNQMSITHQSSALAILASLALLYSCSSDKVKSSSDLSANQVPTKVAAAKSEAALVDIEVDPGVVVVLEVAQVAASALPSVPHIKTKSRLQEVVALTYIEAGLPLSALKGIQQIGNWRRGTALAKLAQACAKQGLGTAAAGFVQQARLILESSDVQQEQGWRRDSLCIAIAEAQRELGLPDAATDTVASVTDAESGKVESLKAKLLRVEDFDSQLKLADEAIATDTFDQVSSALNVCVQLLDRCYADAARREQLLSRIRSSRSKLGRIPAIDLMIQIGDVAVSHGDPALAATMLDEGFTMATQAKWTPEDQVAVQARLAKAFARSGDKDRGRKEADAALSLFDKSRERIVDIYRATALRPIAEAYLAIDDRKTAAVLYGRALEDGNINPNGRPRAEDLVATCCSMVQQGFIPDESLRIRAQQIGRGLGNPW